MKRLVVIGVTLCAAAGQGMPMRDSSDFDFKYEMEELPYEQDLDNDGACDFNAWVQSGVKAPYSEYGFLIFENREAACDIESDTAAGTNGGVWQRYGATAATGFTVEARISVRYFIPHLAPWSCAFAASVPDSASHALLNFTDTAVYWGDTVLATNMNMAEFHTFRIAREAGSSGYCVWCDGDLIGADLGNANPNWGTKNWLLVGGIGGNYRGVTYVSYLRFTKGGYAPAASQGPSPLGRRSRDFEHRYEMDGGDARFSPTATTSDWTVTGDSGGPAASLSGGVLSVTVPEGGLREWVSGPLDPSVSASSPFTFEIRARVRDSWDSAGRVLSLFVGSPRETCYVIIGTNSVFWVDSDRIEHVLSECDNSDGMHVFRIACTGDGDLSKGAGGFTVWRDGEKLSEHVSSRWLDVDSAVEFGVGSRGYGGSFDVGYVRWTTAGDFMPYAAHTGMLIVVE